MEPDADIEGEVGPLDETALEQIREEFTRVDGLVAEAGFDSLLDPTKLVVRLDGGIGDAGCCRFDIRWYRLGYYTFHHTDDQGVDFRFDIRWYRLGYYTFHHTDDQGVDFRFDFHPKPDAPNKHFHEPPDAASADPPHSCITVTEPKLVTRAVHHLWRRAYETDSLEQLNGAENPP